MPPQHRWCITFLIMLIYVYTGLEINFDEEDYSTDEGDKMLSGISLSVRKTQAPFRMELIPVTVDMAETVYNLTAFLSLNDIAKDQRAQSGEICSCTTDSINMCS